MANARIVSRRTAGRVVMAVLVITVLAGASSAAAAGQKGAPDTERLVCFVSILPQVTFVERIGGTHVAVEAMVGPGQSPATYEPTAKQLTRLAGARLYMSIGVPFEDALLPRIERSFEGVTIVDTRAGIDPTPTAGSGRNDHSQGGEKRSAVGGTGHHDALDPHIWLSPRLATAIAVNIRDALIDADPDHQGEYDGNCRLLTGELEDLDAQIKGLLEPVKGGRFYVFHPAYGYFAAEYGLTQVAVELEGATPGPKHLARIIDQARADGVRALFVQPQFSQNTAAMIADAIGAEIIPLDPLAENYTANLLEIARNIAAELSRTGTNSPSRDTGGRARQ